VAFQLTWSTLARQDLREIASYIAEDNHRAARAFVRGVSQVVERLMQFPESGRIVPEFGDPAIREIVRKPCRIVYRVRAKTREIEIVRVWHAARGQPGL